MSRISARVAVHDAICRHREEVEPETLRLFRLHLQVGVRWASPLALALADHERIDLPERLSRLAPALNWLLDRRLSDLPGRGVWAGPPAGSARRDQRLRSHYAKWLRACDVGAPTERLSVRVAEGALQVSGELGPCVIRIRRAEARLTLPEGVPDTILESMRGRDVGVLVGHPAITGRGYIVNDVVPSPFGPGTNLLFGTGLVPFEMPWADLLRAEVSAARRLARWDPADVSA